MENIYKTLGRIAEVEARFNEISDSLEMEYEENGGEVTQETEAKEAEKEALTALRNEIVGEIIDNADGYAECALNAVARRREIEGAYKAWKDSVAEADRRWKSRIRDAEGRENWWKENFEVAMRTAEVEKVGGAKSRMRHSIYFAKSKSIEVDMDVIEKSYAGIIDDFRVALPSFLDFTLVPNKRALREFPVLPDGVTMVEKERVEIR